MWHNTAPLRLASDELLTSNCKKVKVFEEMNLRKEQFCRNKSKYSEEKNDVTEPDKKLSECKRLSHLVCEFDLAKLTHRCQLIPEHGQRRVRLIKIIKI
jgi:hypothetical protein